MTTDGGGWMLVGSGGGSVAASEGSSVTSVDQRIYLPRYSVIILSQDASYVMLANGSSGNKTENKIISTDDKAINVFRSSSTSSKCTIKCTINKKGTTFLLFPL